MNGTLVHAFLRQRLSSPMRLVLLAMQMCFPLIAVALTKSMLPLGSSGFWFAFTFAAGAIGQDVSSGTLQLLLARPVTRPSYVVSRWLACAMAGVALVVLQLLLATMVMMLRGTHPDGLDLVRLLLENSASALAGSTFMIMLSTLASGLGDVALYFLSYVTVGLGASLAQYKNWLALQRVFGELSGVVEPKLGFAWLQLGGTPPWYPLAAWASTLTLCLAIAIARMNRRELSYGTD